MSFDTVNYLLFQKSKKNLDNDILSEFNPWLTTKTFSFYENGQFCDYINNTLNMYSNIFPDKETQFKFYDNIIPKLKKTRTNYIKTPKIENVIKANKEFY